MLKKTLRFLWFAAWFVGCMWVASHSTQWDYWLAFIGGSLFAGKMFTAFDALTE